MSAVFALHLLFSRSETVHVAFKLNAIYFCHYFCIFSFCHFETFLQFYANFFPKFCMWTLSEDVHVVLYGPPVFCYFFCILYFVIFGLNIFNAFVYGTFCVQVLCQYYVNVSETM